MLFRTFTVQNDISACASCPHIGGQNVIVVKVQNVRLPYKMHFITLMVKCMLFLAYSVSNGGKVHAIPRILWL